MKGRESIRADDYKIAEIEAASATFGASSVANELTRRNAAPKLEMGLNLRLLAEGADIRLAKAWQRTTVLPLGSSSYAYSNNCLLNGRITHASTATSV